MKKVNENLVNELNQLLANYQIFYQNLRALHWNVRGMGFFMLHEKYEELYNEAAAVVDEIAERILMIGGKPLHTFDDYLKTATLKEAGYVTDGKLGVNLVLENSRELLGQFYEVMKLAGDDEGTSAMMSEFIVTAEKRIWMLESYLA